MNINNNNSALQIESGASSILGNPFQDGCFLDGEVVTLTLPVPVVVTDVMPPAASDALESPTTPVEEEKEPPAQKDDSTVSVVRTRLGFFEQLSNIVIADGVKTGILKTTTPPAIEIEAEQKQESLIEEIDRAVREVEAARCDGVECVVDAGEGDHPWTADTRCSQISEEKWLKGCQEQTFVDEGISNSKRSLFWRRVAEIQDDDESDEDNGGDENEVVYLPDVADYNCNNNNADPESRFNEFFVGNDNGFHAYQPSAISAQAERQTLERYVPPTSKCRVGGGAPGAPAATEGGRFSKLSADKAGIPWGAKKQRVPSKQKYINQEPYQTLNPSGRWTHGTLQRQPGNKQAQPDREDPFPRYIAKSQKCSARPEYRKKTKGQGIETSAKRPIKKKRQTPINLDAVRCNCPGLFPTHPSHGPGNYWDEEDDDEAILAEMCPGDDLQECGQGVDNVFPLEEWADEWEDGVVSGDCVRGGKLAPGTLELLPWENPCLEELYKRKARIQDLRNKRWEALDKARAEAKKMKAEAKGDPESEEAKKAAKNANMAAKELERKALNEHGQKGWSLMAWFTPTKWADGDCNDCASQNRPGKTCTVRTSSGQNVCAPDGRNNKCSNNVAGDANANAANMDDEIIPKVDLNENMANYEWDQADESDEDYRRRIADSQTKVKIEERKRRIQRLLEKQRQKTEQEYNSNKETESLKRQEVKQSRGVLSSMFGLFSSGSHSNNNVNNSSIRDNGDASIVDVGEENANNNAANRCFRPCPPCPQDNCAPPPFECPCNDIHCPKKLKANKENVQPRRDSKKKNLGVGNVDVSIDISEDLQIEGIDISVKKPPPDLALGCPCGDEGCKKKKCNAPKQKKTYEVCELRNGKMALQEACPVQELERDICDRDSEGGPKECPCTDGDCPKKNGNEDGFVFLYPPTEKIKLDKNGCPVVKQMHCVVTQIGNNPPHVAVKPIGGKLHCDPVPPCPCPEWEKLEKGSCLCSGNAWGEEIDDETNIACNKPVKKTEKSNDCGGSQAEGGLTQDDLEWDFWDSPCDDDIPTPEATPADIMACREFMESRKANSDNESAAVIAALEAFEDEKLRKQKEKVEAETRKRRVAEMRDLGMSEDEIVDQLCSNRVPGPCEIMGEFPPQESCAPNPPPPGCPCPDPDCPKRSPFDYQMHDTDLAKIKNPYDRKNTEKYLQSNAYKTMDCELKNPTYKDLTKSYPKREKTKCPCPECVTTNQKAWAAVEKAKIGPPPDCPCKDAKCPKKPIKIDEKKEEKEDLGICAMKTYYPAQSGCPEVLRCDLIQSPCGQAECNEPPKKPEARYKCHPCSLRKPMPEQAACPDYNCKDCKLVCDKCGCKPQKCKKCEDAEEMAKIKPPPPPRDACPPCTVKGPLPKQTGCKKVDPCDREHPCMCDPNTGEPIDAERCGPCDTKYHDIFPTQGGCSVKHKPLDPCPDKSSNAESSTDADEINDTVFQPITSDDNQKTSNNENELTISDEVTTIEEIPPPTKEPKEVNLEVCNNETEELEVTLIDAAVPVLEAQNNDVAMDNQDTAVLKKDFEVESEVEKTPDMVDEAVNEEAVIEATVTEDAENKEAVIAEAVCVVEESVCVVEDDITFPVEAVAEVTEDAIAPSEIPSSEVSPIVESAETITEEAPEEKTVDAEAESVSKEAEKTFVVDSAVSKGTKANVKVEFRVVGLELTEEELKAVGEAFNRQEAEAAVSKDTLEEELKKAALEAVKQQMKGVTETVHVGESKEKPAVPKANVAGNFSDMEDQCGTSCSFSGMEISAFLPAFLRPKAKCVPQPRKQIEHRYQATKETTGLNEIDEIQVRKERKNGIFHRSGQLRPATDKSSKSSGIFGRNFLAKKHELVLVNNDDGEIDIIKFDRLSEENQASIDKMFNVSTSGVETK